MNWYIQGDAPDPVGPVTTDQVQRGIVAGKVPLTVKVCRKGSSEWFDVTKVQEFEQAIHVVKEKAQGASGWWVEQAGAKPMGPVPTGLIVSGIQSGNIKPETKVSNDGVSGWTAVSELAEFSLLFLEGARTDPPVDPFAELMAPTPEQQLRAAIQETLADGVVTAEKKARLAALQKKLGIAADVAQRIVREEAARQQSTTNQPSTRLSSEGQTSRVMASSVPNLAAVGPSAPTSPTTPLDKSAVSTPEGGAGASAVPGSVPRPGAATPPRQARLEGRPPTWLLVSGGALLLACALLVATVALKHRRPDTSTWRASYDACQIDQVPAAALEQIPKEERAWFDARAAECAHLAEIARQNAQCEHAVSAVERGGELTPADTEMLGAVLRAELLGRIVSKKLLGVDLSLDRAKLALPEPSCTASHSLRLWDVFVHAASESSAAWSSTRDVSTDLVECMGLGSRVPLSSDSRHALEMNAESWAQRAASTPDEKSGEVAINLCRVNRRLGSGSDGPKCGRLNDALASAKAKAEGAAEAELAAADRRAAACDHIDDLGDRSEQKCDRLDPDDPRYDACMQRVADAVAARKKALGCD